MSNTRSLSSILLVLVFLLPVPAAVAQTPPAHDMANMGDNTVTIEDKTGDVDLVVAPKAVNQHLDASAYGQGQYDHLDITKVIIGAEKDKTFQISMGFKVLDSPATARPSRYVTFSYGRTDWQLTVGGCGQQGGTTPAPNSGCLRFRDASSRGYRAVKGVIGERKDGMFVWTIDKTFIFNENRVPARFGDMLKNISGYAIQYVVGGGGFGGGGGGGGGFPDPTGGAYVWDTAPQGGGFSSQAFMFNKGSGGHGDLGLSSQEPIRVTNGEATTIVYKVDLFNHNKDPFKVQIEVKDIQPDWTVHAPSLVKVEGGSSLTFPVVLAMPFRHDHGKTVTFTVHAQAIEDADSNAATDLGVFWTDVPQPSGHHECPNDDTCGQWFHTAPNAANFLPDATDTVTQFKDIWFNGVQKDPDVDANDQNVPAFFNDEFGTCGMMFQCRTPPVWSASWFFPMSPQLLIGMDFDMSKQGLAKLSFMPKLPATSVQVDVALKYCDPTKQGNGGGQGQGLAVNATCNNYNQVLASGSGKLQKFDAQSKAYIEIPMALDPFADLVAYKRGANIGYSVKVTTDIPQNIILTEPRIEFMTTASHLHFPLIEYHDPVDEAFADLGVLALTSQDPFEKSVNPGRTAVYRFDVANKDDILHHVSLDVQGINGEWAQIIGPSVVPLAPGTNSTFMVAVKAPDNAALLERAELFVVAQSQEESWVTALTRLRTTVVDPSQQDIPDEAALAQGKNTGGGSPGFETLLLVAPVVGVATAARPRRD